VATKVDSGTEGSLLINFGGLCPASSQRSPWSRSRRLLQPVSLSCTTPTVLTVSTPKLHFIGVSLAIPAAWIVTVMGWLVNETVVSCCSHFPLIFEKIDAVNERSGIRCNAENLQSVRRRIRV
jgi:hypothetical protein